MNDEPRNDTRPRLRWYQLSLRTYFIAITTLCLFFAIKLHAPGTATPPQRSLFDTVNIGDRAQLLELDDGGYTLRVYPIWDRVGSMGTLKEIGSDYVIVQTTFPQLMDEVVRKSDIHKIQRVHPKRAKLATGGPNRSSL